mgnify:CR=1 FL=1
MKILSIDVGIKNLAFCLLEKDEQEFKILKWDTISLIDQSRCNSCGKPAKFSKNEIHYCRTHAKKSDFLIPTQEIRDLKKLNIGGLKDYIVNNDISCVGYKKADLMKSIEEFNEQKYLNPAKEENAGLISLITIGINMKARLDEILKTVSIDKILIENQLSNIAVRMKSLQGMITQYFIMRGYENIEYICSTNKLKLFLQKDKEGKGKEGKGEKEKGKEEKGKEEKQKTTYSERKKLGIKYCQELLTEKGHDEWLQIFLKHGKKDDLADCLLQGLYIIA